MISSAPIGVGIDIVEFARIHDIRWLERFAEYFLTEREMGFFAKAMDQVAFVASRFAAKEAVIKSFPGFLSPHDFEIIKNGRKPVVAFCLSERDRRYEVLLSITHSTDYAAGYAILRERA